MGLSCKNLKSTNQGKKPNSFETVQQRTTHENESTSCRYSKQGMQDHHTTATKIQKTKNDRELRKYIA